MPTSYPGGIDNFPDPHPGDPQNNPSHSSQHANANDAIEAIELLLGVNGVNTVILGEESTVSPDGTLNSTGISAGAYTNTNLTVEVDGRITAIANGTGGSGTVTSTSVVSANGLAGTVANATTTPAITISTSVTGLLKGNGTAVSAASAGTDYLAPAGNGSALTGITVSQVSGALAAANNLSDVTTRGTARSNLRIPILASVQAVAIANVNIASAPSSVDGYSFLSSGLDTVLLTGQSTGSQDGTWVWNGAGSALTRPTDFPAGASLTTGRSVLVQNGTVFAGTLWSLAVPSSGITIDTTAQTWTALNFTGTTNNEAVIRANRLDQMAAPAGPLNMGSQNIASMAAAVSAGQGAIFEQLPGCSVLQGQATVSQDTTSTTIATIVANGVIKLSATAASLGYANAPGVVGIAASGGNAYISYTGTSGSTLIGGLVLLSGTGSWTVTNGSSLILPAVFPTVTGLYLCIAVGAGGGGGGGGSPTNASATTQVGGGGGSQGESKQQIMALTAGTGYSALVAAGGVGGGGGAGNGSHNGTSGTAGTSTTFAGPTNLVGSGGGGGAASAGNSTTDTTSAVYAGAGGSSIGTAFAGGGGGTLHSLNLADPGGGAVGYGPGGGGAGGQATATLGGSAGSPASFTTTLAAGGTSGGSGTSAGLSASAAAAGQWGAGGGGGGGGAGTATSGAGGSGAAGGQGVVIVIGPLV